MSCPCVPPRHALCVKTQGHRDAQGHPGTPRDAALEMPKKWLKNDFQHFLAGGGMNYGILHYVLHYSLQPRDAQGHPGTPRDTQGRSLRNALEMP